MTRAPLPSASLITSSSKVLWKKCSEVGPAASIAHRSCNCELTPPSSGPALLLTDFFNERCCWLQHRFQRFILSGCTCQGGPPWPSDAISIESNGISNRSNRNSQKFSNGRKIARMARILTIFGRNRSSRRNLSFQKFSNERKIIESIDSIGRSIGRSTVRIDQFDIFSFVRKFLKIRLRLNDRFRPKIVKIRAILAIFRPFEDFRFSRRALSMTHINY